MNEWSVFHKHALWIVDCNAAVRWMLLYFCRHFLIFYFTQKLMVIFSVRTQNHFNNRIIHQGRSFGRPLHIIIAGITGRFCCKIFLTSCSWRAPHILGCNVVVTECRYSRSASSVVGLDVSLPCRKQFVFWPYPERYESSHHRGLISFILLIDMTFSVPLSTSSSSKLRLILALPTKL
jgi:hypothetical protein